MDTIKVYIIIGKHPHYEAQLKNPPFGVSYINWLFGPDQTDFDTMNVYSKSLNLIRKIANKSFSTFDLPAIFYTRTKCDIIHSNSLLMLNNTPWIVEAEHAASFIGLQKDQLTNPVILKRVERLLSRASCKRILPMSQLSKRTIEYFYDTSGFKDKLEVLYPCIAPSPKPNHTVKRDKLRLLFVSNSFFDKGGKEVVTAFIKLKKQYDIELFVKSNVPVNHPHRTAFIEFIKRYQGFPDLFFDTNIYSRNELFTKIYGNSDIFVYPTFGDMFGGFVLLEAMSAGLPCIAPKINAVPEVVDEMQTGLLFDSPIPEFNSAYMLKYPYDYSQAQFPDIVDQLVEKISLLLNDDSLRDKMSIKSRDVIENGKFSVKQRNIKLKTIYEESLER